MSEARSNDSEIPGIAKRDGYLTPWIPTIRSRMARIESRKRELQGAYDSFADFAAGHEYFGLHHKQEGGWVFREWAPNASALFLIGEFSGWKEDPSFELKRADHGVWTIELPENSIRHEQLYKLSMKWPGGSGERLPAWGRRMVQDPRTLVFNAQVWHPAQTYHWRKPDFRRSNAAPLIYEAHVGMAQEKEGVGTWVEFRDNVLPRIAKGGYNTIQLMAVQEHPYYGSFGYHVSNFFAASSRFGTPEDLKSLIDSAHENGIAVIMDVVHSHAVKNEVEGISRFDGSLTQFFHEGGKGFHAAWDSRCFDYGKNEVVHFLLSNCRYWLDEFKFDGFRFDGVTSMMYWDHGVGAGFNSYDDYFGGRVDEDAVTYLALANTLIHEVRPDAITIAEDVSGMAGLGAPLSDGGIGFDFRMAMGVPDYWIKILKHVRDEDWKMNVLWHELNNRRVDEKTVGYCESHDQALVGDKTVIFWLADQEMYWNMSVDTPSLVIDRAIALHKMIRLVTLATSGGAYLNFIGNEFGHPEWVDFPRQGNGWSYKYARRQWHLVDDTKLKYKYLAAFDRAMMELAAKKGIVGAPHPHLVVEHVDDHVLCFERAGLLFLFNFDPNRTYHDYHVAVGPGRYRKVLDSDDGMFGGAMRLSPNLLYIAQKGFCGDPSRTFIGVTLPQRSVIVLERADD